MSWQQPPTQNSDEEAYRAFWTPKNLEDAKKSIIDVPDWEPLTKATVDKLLKSAVCAENETALEIGCGIGRLMIPLSEHFTDVFGVDISPEMVRYAMFHLSATKNCYAMLTDGNTFPVQSDVVDFVYSVICFQHIPYLYMIMQYLKETKRVLKVGGCCTIQTHVGYAPKKFAGFQGHFFESLDAFANCFYAVGLDVVAKEQDGDYLWVTAIKT